jgi:restriction system protein
MCLARLAVLRFRFYVAEVPGKLKMEPWAVTLSIAAVAAIAIAVTLITLEHATLMVVLAIAFLLIAATFAIMPFAFPKVVAALESAVVQAANLHRQYSKDCLATESAAADARRRYDKASFIYNGILRALNYPLSRLLAANLDIMSGPDFERYLADVFRFLGYSVMATGRTGDQGVDLVISRPGSYSIAVQAKCYSTSVGNAAVQEVFAGMAHYRCQRCVVVTSSTFTAAARQLAASTGCTLIERPQLSALIRGQIYL